MKEDGEVTGGGTGVENLNTEVRVNSKSRS